MIVLWGSFFNDFFFQLLSQVLPLLEFLLLLSRDLLERGIGQWFNKSGQTPQDDML